MLCCGCFPIPLAAILSPSKAAASWLLVASWLHGVCVCKWPQTRSDCTLACTVDSAAVATQGAVWKLLCVKNPYQGNPSGPLDQVLQTQPRKWDRQRDPTARNRRAQGYTSAKAKSLYEVVDLVLLSFRSTGSSSDASKCFQVPC